MAKGFLGLQPEPSADFEACSRPWLHALCTYGPKLSMGASKSLQCISQDAYKSWGGMEVGLPLTVPPVGFLLDKRLMNQTCFASLGREHENRTAAF